MFRLRYNLGISKSVRQRGKNCQRIEATMTQAQRLLFAGAEQEKPVSDEASSTFTSNMTLPVHRWFRYSAGFSAVWVEQVLREFESVGPVQVFDPFAGSATTLLAAENQGVRSWGIDAHPFVSRIAKAKLQWRSDPGAYRRKVDELRKTAKSLTPKLTGYPPLIYKCYDESTLANLDVLRQAYELVKDDSPASDLAWLTLLAILRKTSMAGTAQWQYVLPRKQKRFPQDAQSAFDAAVRMIHHDMLLGEFVDGPRSRFCLDDARTCAAVPDRFANLVITSPPYPNNYDYADATRLEMSFMREIGGWGDLHGKVRRHLIRSCSQHVPEHSINLEGVLDSAEADPIRQELRNVCRQLGEIARAKAARRHTILWSLVISAICRSFGRRFAASVPRAPRYASSSAIRRRTAYMCP
jgi:hypothetical protein